MPNEREAERTIAALKLKAAIAATNHEVTSAYHLTAEQLERQKNQKEWDALRAEEASQLDAQRKQAPAFLFQASQWSRDLETLKATRGILIPDAPANLPITDRAMDTAKIRTAYEDLLAVMQSRGQVLSATGKQRFTLYVSVQAAVTQVIDGKEFHLAADDINGLIACLNRMLDLNVFGDEYAALIPEESQPEAVEQTSDELREEASSQWMRIFRPVWEQWIASLAQAPWNFTPDEDQKYAALRYLEQRGTGDALAFDNCRIAMSNAGIFPNLLTADDVLCAKLDAGEWDLSTPAGRAAYARAKNQIHYGTV